MFYQNVFYVHVLCGNAYHFIKRGQYIRVIVFLETGIFVHRKKLVFRSGSNQSAQRRLISIGTFVEKFNLKVKNMRAFFYFEAMGNRTVEYNKFVRRDRILFHHSANGKKEVDTSFSYKHQLDPLVRVGFHSEKFVV